MTRKVMGRVLLLLAVFPATGAVLAGDRLTLDAARRAVAATLDMLPPDDIVFDYRPVEILVADLDDAGTRGIVYTYTATTSGSTGNLPNELVVMTALQPGDRRGQSAYPGNVASDDAAFAILREVGYANEVSVHIPGELIGLEVAGGEIRVRFESRLESPTCKRAAVTAGGEPRANDCPPPGLHHWRYRWTPGHLTLIGRDRPAAAGIDGVGHP
ncbi:hypothetical protein [Stenotrophomonas sp.]|uniref:hypothetical protein n=1 Tax=Stenotrophomonas sp. TaxID=69392 RepID=UPI0028A00274|nr:hypothetical protein [Stenotrophomonas sp.]